MVTGETKARITPSSLSCHDAFVEAVVSPRVLNPPVHPVADPSRLISDHLIRFIDCFSSAPTVRLGTEADPSFIGRLEVSGHRLNQKQKVCGLAPQSLTWRASNGVDTVIPSPVPGCESCGCKGGTAWKQQCQ